MPLRPRRALREARRSAAAHRGASTVLAIVALAMTVTTFVTAGRAAAAEAEILASVETAGPRLIGVSVLEPHQGVGAAAIERVRQLPNVEWVLGLGAARDVSSTGTGARANIAARTLVTALPPLVVVEPGRLPHPGEAIVSPGVAERLQLEHPAGSVRDGGGVRSIVGQFQASGVIADLERLVLVAPDEGAPPAATQLYVLADDALHVEHLVREIRAVAGVPDEQLTIQASDVLLELGNAVSGTIGSFGRQLSIGAIAVGAVLCGLTMTLSMLSRRRDIGRRRALGASRSAIVALALLEAGIPTAIGVALGTVVGTMLVVVTTGALPPVLFAIAAPCLIAVAGVSAAAPPAVLAARQDPMRILRVP